MPLNRHRAVSSESHNVMIIYRDGLYSVESATPFDLSNQRQLNRGTAGELNYTNYTPYPTISGCDS